MRSRSQSLRLAGGAFGIILSLFGAAQGGPPSSGNLNQSEKDADKATKIVDRNTAAKHVRLAADHAPPAAGSTSSDLKLTKTRGRDQAADGELIDQVDRQNRVSEGFFRTEVHSGLKKARDLQATNPEQAAAMLKLLIEKVRGASETSSDLHAQLIDQVETALRTANRQVQVHAERQLKAQQLAAERQAREQINRALTLQEQKVDQVMSRFNALMDEERYRDAETVAAIAEEVQPAQAGLRGAVLTARMVGYTADMNAVRDVRHKGFVDAAFQIELSHVPVAGEPPIVYGDPEAWQLLTERRQKYKAVDLTQHGASETKILAALDEKTDLDFAEQPLTDVIDYLKQRHGIEIQLDLKALADAGFGSDAPVTRSIKGITLRSALKLLLGELDLTYVIRNEVLLITSKTEAENLLSTRVYPVADLVIPITSPRGGGGGMGGGMNGGLGGMSGGMGALGGGMGGMGMGGMGAGMGGVGPF